MPAPARGGPHEVGGAAGAFVNLTTRHRYIKNNRMKDMYIIKTAVAVVAAMVAAGCGQRSESVEMGPGETVEAFCKALAGGDSETAMELCDTAAMNGYIRNFVEALDMQMQADSCVAGIAAGMLTQAEFAVDEVAKEGDRRIVHYTVKVSEDMTKKKTAKVRKDEGVWKVEAISDRN